MPSELAAFSKALSYGLDQLGKQGHKRTHLATQYLVMASEFVFRKLNKHYYENLSELLQAVLGGQPIDEDVSGAAIRLRGIRLKEEYPFLYAYAMQKVDIAIEGRET